MDILPWIVLPGGEFWVGWYFPVQLYIAKDYNSYSDVGRELLRETQVRQRDSDLGTIQCGVHARGHTGMLVTDWQCKAIALKLNAIQSSATLGSTRMTLWLWSFHKTMNFQAREWPDKLDAQSSTNECKAGQMRN